MFHAASMLGLPKRGSQGATHYPTRSPPLSPHRLGVSRNKSWRIIDNTNHTSGPLSFQYFKEFRSLSSCFPVAHSGSREASLAATGTHDLATDHVVIRPGLQASGDRMERSIGGLLRITTCRCAANTCFQAALPLPPPGIDARKGLQSGPSSAAAPWGCLLNSNSPLRVYDASPRTVSPSQAGGQQNGDASLNALKSDNCT
ncbi:hypothetical protein E2C01_024088 [Portunus trituberculatus]|uniref:Uncharacterized protein n=1 Tax=Portunus trituberculatus TaxID=210409 RepID=A0A5B7EBR4_PORTR|nr:hypothetical protein [Portunus trituberculatus]